MFIFFPPEGNIIQTFPLKPDVHKKAGLSWHHLWFDEIAEVVYNLLSKNSAENYHISPKTEP